MQYELTGKQLYYNLPEGEFTMRDIRNLYEIAHFGGVNDLFCFMCDLSLIKIHTFLKNTGFGKVIQFNKLPSETPLNFFDGSKSDGIADKFTYGDVNIWFIPTDIYSHPLIYEKHINNMTIATKDYLEEFIKHLNNTANELRINRKISI